MLVRLGEREVYICVCVCVRERYRERGCVTFHGSNGMEGDINDQINYPLGVTHDHIDSRNEIK